MKVKSKWLTGRSRSTQTHLIAWRYRGFVYKIAGLPEEAVRSFERAIRMSPVDPRYTCRLLGWGWPLLSLVALTRPSSQGRKPNARTPPFRQLTAVSLLLSPISDVTLRRVRRRRICLRPIPLLQYLRTSLGRAIKLEAAE